MPIQTIDLTATLADLLAENSYTLGQLQSHPLAAPLAGDFDDFQAKWMSVDEQRIALTIAVYKANGAVAGADASLDDLVDTLDKTLLIATKNDRTAPLYRSFFGEKLPSELKKAASRGNLDTVAGWIDSLNASTTASLKALGQPFAQAVGAATNALAAQAKAERALKEFDTVGEKKALIDQCNSIRSVAHGKLDALPHDHPEAMLPKHFGDRFFIHSANKGLSSLHTIAAAQAKLDLLDKQRAQVAQHLADLQTAATAKAAAKQAAIADAASVAQARKEAADAVKKLRQLEKQAKSGKKKAR